MAISAVAVTTTDTLETFRVEFNNLVADVASLEQVGAANIVISDGGNIGTASDADAMSISAGGVVTFSQTPSFTAGITVSNLDIDGATDIGAAIVDADLFIVDDGASGTNRKTVASRIKTYIADVTLTTAAQTAITSVGTLTALDVDNININGNTISASSGAVNITPAGGSAIVLDGTINVDAGVVTGVTSLTSNNILIADAGTIGSASSTSAIAIASDGDVTLVDDLKLGSDSARIFFGASNEILLEHIHNVGLQLRHNSAGSDDIPIVFQLKSEEDAIVAADVIASLEFAAGDSDGTDGATVAAGIHAIAEGTFSASANATKLVFTTGVSETAAASATAKMTLSSAGLLTIADDFMLKDGGTIGVASTNDAITISSAGIVTFKDDIVIKDDGTIGTATTPGLITLSSNNVRLTNTATADTDAVLQLYSEVGDNGSAPDMYFWRNSASPADNDFIGKILFYGENDASEQTPYASIMTQIMDVSDGTEDGQIKFTTLAAGANSEYLLGSDGSGATFRIPNGSHIGSAGDRDSIAIASDGVVTMNQIPVFSAGINVSGGSIAGTLSTAAQTNITSLGTLTALTVDDINLNGKVLTITGDTSDTFTITAAAAGFTTIATTDAAGADGHLNLDIDGALIIDAGDSIGQTQFKKSGTEYLRIFKSGTPATIHSGVSDADLVLSGNDGGSTVNALTLDMSENGAAIFLDDVTVGDDLFLITDDSEIHFGVGSEVKLTHLHNSGLRLTHLGAGDNLPVVFQLKSEENEIIANEVIASLEFAAGDSDGTDGATVAAGIHAIAEGTFSASANATKLVFTTGVSETAASSATAKMTLSSAGLLTIADDFMIKDGGTIGVASTNDAMTISSAGIVTFKDDIIIKDGGTIGSASDTDAIAISSGGVITVSATTATTSVTTGALVVGGGVGIGGDIRLADDLVMGSDSSRISFGGDSEITMTHVHDVGLTLTHFVTGGNKPFVLQLKSEEDAIVADDVIASIEMAAGDSDGTDGATVAAGIHAIAEDTFSASANATKLVFTTGVSETAASSATAKMTLSSAGLLTIADDFVIKDGGTIGSASDTDAISISSGGVVNISATTASTGSTSGALTVAGGMGVAADLGVGDDLRFDSDLATIRFGEHGEIVMSHVHNSGLTFTNFVTGLDGFPFVLQLKSEEDAIVADDVIASIEMAAGDSDGTDGATVAAGIHAIAEGTFSASANATKLVFTTGVSETAASSATAKMTLSSAGLLTIADDFMIKDGGTIGVASTNDAITISSAGIVTFKDDIIIKDGGTIGSASDTDAITISSGGVVTVSATTATTSTSTGALVVGGGVGIGGDIRVGDDIVLQSDAPHLYFGANSEIRLKHVHDVGLTLINNISDTDNTPVVFQLKSEEDAIVADDVIASIEMAAGDSDGTDGATVAAGIHAIAEDTFSASANATKLVFTTGVSETAASSATAKMTLSSAGLLTIADDFVIKDGGTIGSVSATDAITIASNGDVTLTGASYNVVWDKSENSLEFADNARAKFGTSGDLEIWHDGSNSNIKSGGAGSLIIQSNFSETGIVVVPNGQVALYHNNVAKLETTAAGATITGELLTTGFSSSDFAAAKIVMNRSATDGTDAGDNIIDETDSDNMLMENVTSWVTSGFTIRDSFGNHLQTVNGVS